MTDVERAPPATATVSGVSPGNEPTNSDNDSDCNQFGGNLSIHRCIRRCLVSTSKQKREGAGPRGPAWRGKAPRETLPPEIQFRRIEGGSKGTVRIPPGPLLKLQTLERQKTAKQSSERMPVPLQFARQTAAQYGHRP